MTCYDDMQEGKLKYLGSFPTEIEAARVYDAAAIEYHKERAILNFAPDGRNDGTNV